VYIVVWKKNKLSVDLTSLLCRTAW